VLAFIMAALFRVLRVAAYAVKRLAEPIIEDQLQRHDAEGGLPDAASPGNLLDLLLDGFQSLRGDQVRAICVLT
jgi:hypothetical protein